MGQIQHYTIIVTNHCLKLAYKKAIKIFGKEQVSPLYKYTINGGEAFIVFSNGSKVGWPEYVEHKENIKKFVEYLHKKNIYYDIIDHGEFGSHLNEDII